MSIGVEVRRTVPKIETTEDDGPEEFTPDPDYEGWADAEVDALVDKATREQRRRRTMKAAEEAVDRGVATFQAALGRKDGAPWSRPESVAAGYAVGAEATHNGYTWTNSLPSNVHEPGVAGWSIKRAPGDPPPPFIKPVVPQDAYAYGDEVTGADGVAYRSIFDLGDGLNWWSPEEMPEYWELVTDGEPEEPPETPPTPETPEEPDEPEEPGDDEGDVPVWVRPVWGAEEGGAYAKGDRVRYPNENGPVYVSVHGGWNTWAPDEYGWEQE